MPDSITRRDALKRLALTGAGGTALLSAAGRSFAQDNVRRPNIIFILTDDQRWDAMSCMGHPFLKTPNMDRIRSEGVLFSNAFVTISLCSPSRACFLTGTYAHTNGVFGNWGCEFAPEKTPSFPMLLQKAGYETAFVGKWHMNRSSNPRPGFDYWFSFSGQGVYTDPEVNENGNEFNAKGYMTDILNDKAVAFLKKERARPFCLYLSHKAVHGPFKPAERHKDLYSSAEMAKPKSFDDTFEGKPRWQRAALSGGGKRGWMRSKRNDVPDSIPPAQWQPTMPGRIDYFRSLNAVDEGIGQIFDTLEAAGRLDDTMIVFAGDNGYFLGEHRRGDKRLMYEESLRIPLIARYPRLIKAGSTVDEMVLNIDVAPTFLDVAGVPVPPVMQGKSFKPLVEGRKVPWRESFLYEYFVDLTPSIPRIVGVRTKDWKCVSYPDANDIDELYDLKNDPEEMKNLSQNPQYADKVKNMRAEMQRLMKETGYRTPEEERAATQAAAPILIYSFDKIEGDKVKDESGKGNDGTIKGAKIVEGRKGKGLEFTGNEYVDVPKSESQDPSGSTWSVEVWVKPKADGVILARGGKSAGYILAIENRVPEWGVRSGRLRAMAAGDKPITGKWTHLVGCIAPHAVKLYVDGQLADTVPTMGVMRSDPNDGLTIGADKGSPVDEKLSMIGFRGIIDEVEIYKGEMTPERIKAKFEAGRR